MTSIRRHGATGLVQTRRNLARKKKPPRKKVTGQSNPAAA